MKIFTLLVAADLVAIAVAVLVMGLVDTWRAHRQRTRDV